MSATTDLLIAGDDPRAEDVKALVERHLTFASSESPACHVHALAAERLADQGLTLFSARDRSTNALLGIGALRHLDAGHAEIKSMHTASDARDLR